MPSGYNAAFAYRNLADAGTVSASSSLAAMPAAMLQDPHVGRKWRGLAGASEFLLLDLGSARSLDTVMLAGVSLTSAGTVQVRLSASDPSGAAGTVYDSGPLANAIDPAFGMLVHLMPSVAAGRYLRIDLTEPGAAYLEAGRLFAGRRVQVERNFAYGWTSGRVDRSRKSEGRGGQIFVDRDNSYRVMDLTFDALTETERNGFVEEMDRVCGEHADILLVTNPTSTNLGRDSIWGLMDGMAPISQPHFEIYAKSYKLRERL